jgi:hypothetical protein
MFCYRADLGDRRIKVNTKDASYNRTCSMLPKFITIVVHISNWVRDE